MRATALAFALAMVGCGGLKHVIDRDLLHHITIENKLTLFDAENDVFIAFDEREQIQRQIREARVDVAEAQAQIREAQSDQERAEQKNDDKAVELARRTRDVFERKIEYLHAHIDFLRDRLAAQDDLVRVAQAKFELAKAKLVKKNNIIGAQDLELADFELQVDEAVGQAKANQRDLTETEGEVLAIKNEWLKERTALAQASGGGVGSAWAEDSAAWGNW